MKKTINKLLSMIMILTMLIGILSISVWATDHVHDESCGYAAPSDCTHIHDDTCGYEEAVEGAECTHTHDESCGYSAGSACNYAVVPANEHTHLWSDDWSYNDGYHWHNCTAEGCDLPAHLGEGKDGFAHHEFDIADSSHHSFSPVDVIHFGTCVICGKTDSQILHVTTLQKDDTHHWYECSCGVTEWAIDFEKGEHRFDGDADITCNDCSYVRTASGGTTVNGVITLTPADLVDGASGEGWSFVENILTISSGYTLKFDGTCGANVDNYGTIESGTFSDYVNNDGTITGGTFSGGVDNNSTITGGTFSGGVENYGTITDGIFNGNNIVLSLGTIENGIFNYIVHNRGTIEGGTFNNQVENYKGTIRWGSFYASVKNTAIGATIEGGSFQGDVTNYQTITGGTFSGKLTNNQGSISGITIELSNALIEGGESYGWSLDGNNNLILNSGISFYWKAGETCEYRVENNGTITGGTFSGQVENNGTITGDTFLNSVTNLGSIKGGTFSGNVVNHSTISGGTFTKNVINDSTIENGSFDCVVVNIGSGTIRGGNFNLFSVDNEGTIEGGSFNGDVQNDGTISGGVFTGSMANRGTVTGAVDLSTLIGFREYGGRYGKDVKLPKAVIRGELTYTGCESSTEITLEYYADGVKTAEWTVSGERYSYPVEKYRRTDPEADLSGIEGISHEVKAVPMDGYEISIDNPIWDRFHVTVTALHTHSYGTDWKSDGANHWHECSCGAKFGEAAHSGGMASCTKKAVCADCGVEYGELAAHTYGNWKVVKKATDTEKGKEQRSCSVCGHVESRDIPKLTDVPKTGDDSHILLWAAVLCASMVGIAGSLTEKLRRKQKN